MGFLEIRLRYVVWKYILYMTSFMTVFIQIKLPKDMHFMKSLEGTVVCNSYKKPRTATEMDGTLHTDFWKSETSRDIKKYF